MPIPAAFLGRGPDSTLAGAESVDTLGNREEFATLRSSTSLDVQFVDLSYTTYEMGALDKAALNTKVFLGPN